ncbi:MAG: hypothetical protein AB7G11_16015 [Phycisphaerales bacterium]
MPDAVWISLIVAAVVVVGIIVLRKTMAGATIKVPGASATLKTHKPSEGAAGGATMTGVKAGGSARNTDGTGKGAAMSNVEAGGDVENSASSEPGAKRPK